MQPRQPGRWSSQCSLMLSDDGAPPLYTAFYNIRSRVQKEGKIVNHRQRDKPCSFPKDPPDTCNLATSETCLESLRSDKGRSIGCLFLSGLVMSCVPTLAIRAAVAKPNRVQTAGGHEGT